MSERAPRGRLRRGRLAMSVGKRVLAASLASLFVLSVPLGAASAQEAWRSLNVLRYSNASDYAVETDKDEYDIRFRSQDDVRAVFDFYRGQLERQGFRVTDSRPTSHGFKADLVRGQGGPSDSVELDVKLKGGWHRVEIEFDD